MNSSVVALAARCTAAVYAEGRFLGSGFLVAPGQVLTCAHVAAGAGAADLRPAWPGASFSSVADTGNVTSC